MVESEQTWIKGIVVSNTHWTPDLFSLRIEADMAPYLAGQYTTLGIEIDGTLTTHPYSILSAPGQNPLEFFLSTRHDGHLTSRLGSLPIGATIWVQRKAAGSLTIKDIPDSDTLWMLATGTGVAPFLSILQTQEVWQRFETVVLAYAMRRWIDLGYGALLRKFSEQHNIHFKLVPFVSREKIPDTIHGHIPASISNGTLERLAGSIMSPQNSQLMLCGNQGMVKDAVRALKERRFNTKDFEKNGEITLESY